MLAPGLQGSPTHRKRGISSVFSLFNLKANSRFWTESVLHGGESTWLFVDFFYFSTLVLC